MAKKKAKKAGGEKKKVKKKEATKDKTKTKEPTEKELFELKISELKLQFEETDKMYQELKEKLDQVKNLQNCEIDSKESCVSYLKRVLKFEHERRLDIQEKLQTLRDQTERVERRALGKLDETEKSEGAAKSQFLTQKLELEGKLAMLEELRLKRNTQMAHLKRVENAIEEKIFALREKTREEDMRQVDKLLKNRENFLQKCQDIKREWREAFPLRMPVHATRQLKENVRLRGVCDRATENLLKLQDRNRQLKSLKKSLQLKEEILSSAEKDTQKQKFLQEKRLKQLLQDREELDSTGVQIPKEFVPLDNVDSLQNNIIDQILKEDCKLKKSSDSQDEMKVKLDAIDEVEIEKCQLLDRRKDVDAILEDQSRYKIYLEKDLAKIADRNGVYMSALLRAGKIFETRCGKLNLERKVELDFDLLHQIRSLLDHAQVNSHKGI